MRATIKDVAKAAGVSPTTVSFVINNKPVSISEVTKARVYKAIKDLNYHPNQLAVSLVTKSTNTIGMIVPSVANPFHANLSHKIRELFLRRNILAITGTTDYNGDIMATYLRSFEDRNVDGLILSQLDFESKEDYEMCRKIITESGLPVVFYGRDTLGSNDFSSVSVDQVQIGYLATRHLILLGHKRIACAAGNMDLDVCRLRYEGYQKALQEAGIPEEPGLVFNGDFSIESGENALPYLLGLNATAIFAFSDMIAYGIYKQCKSYNISIPDDLSVVGVDDLEFSEIINPPLTTIAQPMDLIAHSLVNTMLKELKDSSTHSQEVVHTFLKVRGSTAGCRR